MLAIGNLPPKSPLDNGLLCSPWCRSIDYRLSKHLPSSEQGSRHWMSSWKRRRPVMPVATGSSPLTANSPGHTLSPPFRFRLNCASGQRSWRRPGRNFARFCGHFSGNGKSGVHWQPLVDSLRRVAPDIWTQFRSEGQTAFPQASPYPLEHPPSPLVSEKHSGCDAAEGFRTVGTAPCPRDRC